MILYGRRNRQKPANGLWRAIQRCQHRITEMRQDACRSGDGFKSPITPKDQAFLDHLAKRGRDYLMSQGQIHWFNAIANKVNGRPRRK